MTINIVVTLPPFFKSIPSSGKVVSHCQQGAMAVVKMSWDDAQKLAEECHVEVILENLNMFLKSNEPLNTTIRHGWGILYSVH